MLFRTASAPFLVARNLLFALGIAFLHACGSAPRQGLPTGPSGTKQSTDLSSSAAPTVADSLAACLGGLAASSCFNGLTVVPIEAFARCPTGSGDTCFAVTSARADRSVATAAAPAVPQSLVSQVSGNTVTLTWLAPSGGDPALGYVIEAGSASGLANLASLSQGAVTNFATSGVPAGTYHVRVRALNAAGLGPASNEVIVTVGGSSCVPAPQP